MLKSLKSHDLYVNYTSIKKQVKGQRDSYRKVLVLYVADLNSITNTKYCLLHTSLSDT